MTHNLNRNAPFRVTAAAGMPALLDTVLDALAATGRISAASPDLGLGDCFRWEKMTDFYLEKHPGGWVANVAFDAPPGLPNTLGTPDARPFKTQRQAFLAGAALVCEIVTGSPELPFFIYGDRLIVIV